MSVNYRVIERVNPRDLTLPNKYYAQIINGDDVSFDELAVIISKMSNLNYGTVLGTLGTLVEVIELQLSHGRQVKLSNLGTLFLTLSSDGVEEAEDFHAGHITRANIRFRPGARLKRMSKNLHYEKVSTPAIVEMEN